MELQAVASLFPVEQRSPGPGDRERQETVGHEAKLERALGGGGQPVAHVLPHSWTLRFPFACGTFGPM